MRSERRSLLKDRAEPLGSTATTPTAAMAPSRRLRRVRSTPPSESDERSAKRRARLVAWLREEITHERNSEVGALRSRRGSIRKVRAL